jgi:hypothetical protein
MYWTKAYQRSEKACAQMKQIAEQVLSMYRARAISGEEQQSSSQTTVGMRERAAGGEAGDDEDSAGADETYAGAGAGAGAGDVFKGSIMRRIIEHNYPSDAHRISEIISFIVAGHETSAFSLCFFLFEMARHPVERRRLQEELDAAITPETCPNGRPTLAQVHARTFSVCALLV